MLELLRNAVAVVGSALSAALSLYQAMLAPLSPAVRATINSTIAMSIGGAIAALIVGKP